MDGSVIPDSWRLAKNELPPPPKPKVTVEQKIDQKLVEPPPVPEVMLAGVGTPSAKNYKMKSLVPPPGMEEEDFDPGHFKRKSRQGLKPAHLKRRQALAVALTPEEEYLVRSYIYTHGFRSISDFIRKSMFYVMHTKIGEQLAQTDSDD